MPAIFTTVPYELRAEIASYLSWRDFNCFRQIDSRNYDFFTSDRIRKQFPLTNLQVTMITRLGGVLTKDQNISRASKFLHTVVKAAGLTIRHPSISPTLNQSPFRPRNEADLMRSDFLGCIHRRNIFGLFETLHNPSTEYNTPMDVNIIEVQTKLLRYHSFAYVLESAWSFGTSSGLSRPVRQQLETALGIYDVGNALRKYLEGYSRNTKNKVISGGVGRWILDVLKWGRYWRDADEFRDHLEQVVTQLKEIDYLMTMFNNLHKNGTSAPA